MKLTLKRKKNGKSTLGELYVDGFFECYTLEDTVRQLGPNGEGKIFGETAIPAGTYKIIINMSQRFQKMMMRLVDVPFFDGILIHKGNTEADTHGCILVGSKLQNDAIAPGSSTPAYNSLYPKVSKALCDHQEVEIEIINEFN